LNNWLQLITWSALQLLREIVREAARSGKSIEELLSEAEARTALNDQTAKDLIARLAGGDHSG